MPVWVVLGVTLLLTGCGSGVATHSSPSPTPSPTPTVLSQKQQLILYLHAFGRYDKRETAIVKADSAVSNAVSRMYTGDDFSAIRARVLKNAQRWNDLSVDYAALEPPQCAAGSNKLYVRFLRNAYLSDRAYADYLKSSGTEADRRRADKFGNLAQNEYLAWSFSLRVTARKLHVHIPFEINET